MKKTIALILALVMAVAVSAGALAAHADASQEAVSANALVTALQEADKFYRTGHKEAVNPITVVFEDANTSRNGTTVASLSTQFSFEAVLDDEDPRSKYETMAEIIAEDAQDKTQRAIAVDRKAYDLIVAFTGAMYEAFVTQEKPDLSGFFDLSNDARIQNLFLVEHHAYLQAIIQPSPANSVSNQIDIQNVTELDGNALLLDFRVVTSLAGNPVFAQNEQAYLVPTNAGYKIVKYWIQHIDFVSLQEDISSEVSFDQNTNSDYATQLLRKVEAAKVINATLKPMP